MSSKMFEVAGFLLYSETMQRSKIGIFVAAQSLVYSSMNNEPPKALVNLITTTKLDTRRFESGLSPQCPVLT